MSSRRKHLNPPTQADSSSQSESNQAKMLSARIVPRLRLYTGCTQESVAEKGEIVGKQMQRRLTSYLVALGLALGAAPNGFGQGPTFTTIDYPGSTGTMAWAINPHGDIVGIYTLADKTTHGFLLTTDGNFTAIDFPGAPSTQLLWD